MTRRQFASGLAATLTFARAVPLEAAERRIRFGVFSLFEPQELTLSADCPLLLEIDGQRFALAADDGLVLLRRRSDAVEMTLGARILTASRVCATALGSGLTSLVLGVPPTARHGGIRRGFHGSLDLRVGADRLQPVIAMDRETAVASIVAAESPAHAPQAFVTAQAIASRSFLLAARTGHAGFDFCDTTHCQFLRGPAAAGSAASVAAARTAGLCLCYDGRPFAAMYSRSCAGRTCSLDELGLPIRDYPYYSVDCAFCGRHPETWSREIEATDLPRGERERIAFGRIHGWSAVPSDSFTRLGSRLEGRGMGHGLGLCQRGAAAMAGAGAEFDSILGHYYPNTRIAPASVG